MSQLAADTLAVGNGTESDVSGAMAMTALILYGASYYSAYDAFHTTIYSGATQNWNLVLPETAGTNGQVLVNIGSGFTEWESVSTLGVPWSALTGDLTETQVIPWDGGTVGTPDTGISRISAGVLGIGTGAQGSIAGSLSLANATISGLTTASAITGSLAGLKLATPSAPTITPNTSGGGTSYSYKIVAKDQNGTTLAGILSTCGSVASTAGSTSTGQSVLSGSVYNTLAWAAVTGAVSYDVYRTAGGATQGYIGNTSLLTFNDTGLTGNGWTAPAYNTSGSVVEAFDSQAGNGNFFTSIGEVWKAAAPTGYAGLGQQTELICSCVTCPRQWS